MEVLFRCVCTAKFLQPPTIHIHFTLFFLEREVRQEMGKFGSGILDGKNVSKIPKPKGIDLLGVIIFQRKRNLF